MEGPALLPRQRAGSLSHSGYATERSKHMYAARLLCRSNELLHAIRAFAAWAAATRERKLKGHMNRCSTMMKRTVVRQDYCRFFLRWLAYTQSRFCIDYRCAIQLRKDVPLRSKSDFLVLARRYFAKWRTHLREKKQRSATNVELLTALNRERLRSRALLRWWRYYHMNTTKRHKLESGEQGDTTRRLQAEVQKAVNEAEALRDRLAAALQEQGRLQAEIRELRESMCTAIETVEGSGGPSLLLLRKWRAAVDTSPAHKSNPSMNVVDVTTSAHSRSAASDMPPPLASTVADSPLNSAQHSRDTQAMLMRCLENAIVALAELGCSTSVPLSIDESINSIRRRLDDDAEELASVKLQRDELAAAARTARLAFASTTAAAPPSLGATANSVLESELEGSRAASVASSRLGNTGNNFAGTSASRTSHRSGNRRSTGAAAAIISGSFLNASLQSGITTPTASLPNSPGESALVDGQDLPRLLIADAKNIVNTVGTLRKGERQAKKEVSDLQDAALRAIDALGGSGVVYDNFAAPPDETAEARAQRSNTIAVSLRNLCEDMIVVLVLTSMWSGKRASERVSEALERLWRRTQDLESTHSEYLQQLDDLVKVVHVAARLLRQPQPAVTPGFAASTPCNITPRRASVALARRRHNNVVPDEDEAPPTTDELDDARRVADALAAKGDHRPVELLRRCEEAVQRARVQSTVLTSELEGLLQSSQDLLAATVGVDKDVAATRSAASLSVSSRDQLNESTPSCSTASPSPQEVVAALKAATRKVARIVTKVKDTAETPLVVATQDVLAQLEQAKKAHADAEKQLRASETQLSSMESRQAREKEKLEVAEQKLRQQLEALGEQNKQNEVTRKQLETQMREAETQARLAERAHKKELDDLVKAQNAVEKQLQQQLKAIQQEVEQQEQEKRLSEKEITALQSENKELEKAVQKAQEALEKEKVSHARTQQALDAQLKAAKSDTAAISAAMAKLQEQLQALQQECRHSEDEKRHLEDDLNAEKTAHEQALRDCEEEMTKAAESQRSVVEETRKLTSDVEALKKELQERFGDLEKQQAESDAIRRDLEAKLAAAKAASEADAAVRARLEGQLLFIEGENRTNNAVGVFLRDVLRDCLTRLHHLTRSVGTADLLSPRASLTLQQARNAPPPPLTHDSDPSNYVEYILRLDGNDPTGKRLVQEHLRENCAVHGIGLPVVVPGEDESAITPTATAESPCEGAAAGGAASAPAGDSTADPSTWEVVAELHDRLVLLYERFAQLDQVAADQLAVNDALWNEKNQLCTDALMTLQQLQPWSPTASVAATAATAAPATSCPTSPPSAATSPPSTAEDTNNHTVRSVGATVCPLQPDVAGAALRTSSSEITQALELLQQVVDSVRPLVQLRSPTPLSLERASAITTAGSVAWGSADTAAPTEHLQSLVTEVQGMASCLQHLSESVQHGIIALGGATADDEGGEKGERGHSEEPNGADHTLREQSCSGGGNSNAGGDSNSGVAAHDGARQLDGHALATRLEEICTETGNSILEVKHLLVGSEATSAGELSASQVTAKPLKLGDVIPQIRAKMAELEEVKRESARMLNGLNRAFDDDEESLFAASMSSTQSRSLKPKKKPLPAFQGTPEAGLRLLQQEIKGKKKHRTGGPPDGTNPMASFSSNIRERLGDLQNLRQVCCNTLQVLEGRASSAEDGTPPSYGEALVTLLKTQMEDLKQALAESEEALKGYRSDLRNVTVGTRLHLLADVVNSLKLERDSLKEDINRRGRQSNALLADLNKEVKILKKELAAHQQDNVELATMNEGVSEELEAQKRNAAELAARLAQLQHESNVLSSALANALGGLPASAYYGQPSNSIEKNVQAALKIDHGDALTTCVEAALQAATQHLQQLRDTFHSGFTDLRTELQALRELVAQGWPLYGAPMAEAAVQLVTETAEMLTLENNMLRPRAVERETLKLEVATLETTLADAVVARNAAIERLSHLDNENTQLRRALRDAEMTQVLNGTGDDSRAAAAAAAASAASRQVDWERRMIAAATDLTMDAIDSMSGRSMSAVFGAVAEETLRLYKGVQENLRVMEQVCAMARGTDGRRQWAEVAACLDNLDALSASADYLQARLPVLYRFSYP